MKKRGITSHGKKRIGFLIGSGFSRPAGLPSTGDITDQILSGKRVMRHTDGNFYFGEPLYAHMGFPDEYVPRIVEFLNIIKSEIDDYYKKLPVKSPNYEDICYLARQIYDSELGEYDNPAIQPLIDKITPKIEQLLIGKEHEAKDKWELYELAHETINYIADIVWLLLLKQPTSFSHLAIIKDAFNDNRVSTIDIHTLNHDTVIEDYLKNEDIAFVDGFHKPTDNLRFWNPTLYKNNSVKIRLFKLHGSINWFRFRPHRGSWEDERIGIPLKWDLKQSTRAVERRPIFLVGTYNKMLEYISGIYFDVFYQLYSSLRGINRLIITGYGFGDKGINTQIIDWIYLDPNHKTLIIHPNPNGLKETSRGSIRNKWDNWLKEGRLRIISKGIEDTSWQEIKETLIP